MTPPSRTVADIPSSSFPSVSSASSPSVPEACRLPVAWTHAAQWRVLEINCSPTPCDGLNFLRTWAAWQRDPSRCRLLHYVVLSSETGFLKPRDLLAAEAELAPLAMQLTGQAWGLMPGIQRLAFDQGQVLLTVCIGDPERFLRQQDWQADAVFLDAPAGCSSVNLKAIARCCAPNALLATQNDPGETTGLYGQCGFVEPARIRHGPAFGMWQLRYAPGWPLQRRRQMPSLAFAPTTPVQPARCIVIGAGLAGASAAVSLARRGWQVQVLDAGDVPAAGASGLPVGLFAPNLSADDNAVARISRAGVRATLDICTRLLQPGLDWSPTGVLERSVAGKAHRRSARDRPGAVVAGDNWADWGSLPSANQLAESGLTAHDDAWWHARAGWVRPARLVAAMLAQPGISFLPRRPVNRLQLVSAPTPQATSAQDLRNEQPQTWQALDEHGGVLAQAECVVIASGPASAELIQSIGVTPPPLNSIRGQMSWGMQREGFKLPPFPINGKGALTGQIPIGKGLAWHAGSTFERGKTTLDVSPAEKAAAHSLNWQNLRELLPVTAEQLRPEFEADGDRLQSWAGVRCTVPDRLPLVGPVAASALPGLLLCTGMGARGLSRAVLCGELLAAQLHGEPLPLDQRLAMAMAADRFTKPGLQPVSTVENKLIRI